MNLLATINRGAPPIGLGAFQRASYVDGPWAWVAIVADANYAADVGAARAAGKQVWLYSMPGAFLPGQWRDGLANLIAKAAAVGAEGIIVDPENGWDASHAGEIPAFGQALQDAAQVTRVGITSYPSWGPIVALAQASGDACFGVPQIYGQPGAFTQAEIDSQWSRWRGAFGTRLIPALAAWIPDSSPTLATAEGYAAYLARIPRAGGAIVWTTGQIPVHMMDALQRYSPGGNVFAMAALAGLAWAGRPVGAIAIGLAIAAVILGILLARSVTRA